MDTHTRDSTTGNGIWYRLILPINSSSTCQAKEGELIEAQFDILAGKFDMVVRISGNTGRLLDGVRAYHLTIFRGHGRGIDLLVEESGYIASSPIFLLVLNRRLKVIGVLDVELDQFGHIGWILASLSRSIAEIFQSFISRQVLIKVSVQTYS